MSKGKFLFVDRFMSCHSSHPCHPSASILPLMPFGPMFYPHLLTSLTFQKQNLIFHPLNRFEEESLLTNLTRIIFLLLNSAFASPSSSFSSPAYGIQGSIDDKRVGAKDFASAGRMRQ